MIANGLLVAQFLYYRSSHLQRPRNFRASFNLLGHVWCSVQLLSGVGQEELGHLDVLVWPLLVDGYRCVFGGIR